MQNITLQTEELTAEIISHAGVITLTRPKALNALSLGMIRSLTEALTAWRDAPEVKHVIIKSSETRSFCAGGDIRAVYEAVRAGVPDLAKYFAEEYSLNEMIATYPKPYTALIEGYVMGGGVGISIHGKNRVGTEHITWAMPETAIGFMPDVGASHFLNQIPHKIGVYLGMTSARLNTEQTIFAGILTHHVPAHEMRDVFEKLCAVEHPESVLSAYKARNGGVMIAHHAEEIEKLFTANSWQEVLDNLRIANTEFATTTLATLEHRCPMSVAVTFEMLKASEGLSLHDCLLNETRIAANMIVRSDFMEGVRAVVVDKTNDPHWNPTSFAQVDSQDVHSIIK